jgi:hypothetical protein
MFFGPLGPSPLEPRRSVVMKRLVAGVFVSAFAIVGIAPAASAAPSSEIGHVKVVKLPKTFRIIDWDVIDWDAPPADGGSTVQRAIDWD